MGRGKWMIAVTGLVIGAVFFASCDDDVNVFSSNIVGSGNIISQTFEISDFSNVEVATLSTQRSRRAGTSLSRYLRTTTWWTV